VVRLPRQQLSKNIGMRINHLLVTTSLRHRVVWTEIDREARKGKPLPSDHAPLVIDIDSPGYPLPAGRRQDSRIAARWGSSDDSQGTCAGPHGSKKLACPSFLVHHNHRLAFTRSWCTACKISLPLSVALRFRRRCTDLLAFRRFFRSRRSFSAASRAISRLAYFPRTPLLKSYSENIILSLLHRVLLRRL
jgi:hypothetical protein